MTSSCKRKAVAQIDVKDHSVVDPADKSAAMQ